MANKGISNIRPVASAIQRKTLFCIMMSLLFVFKESPSFVLLDFFFSMTSPAQTWSQAEIASWQEEAGLLVRKAIYFRGSRDYGQQVAVKPGR